MSTLPPHPSTPADQWARARDALQARCRHTSAAIRRSTARGLPGLVAVQCAIRDRDIDQMLDLQVADTAAVDAVIRYHQDQIPVTRAVRAIADQA